MEKKKLNERLGGRRIHLKKHDIGLAETMYKYVDADRERLSRFMPWAALIKSVEDEQNFIEVTLKQWESCVAFDYGIFLNEGDCYIGNIGVHTVWWHSNKAELGYWILGDFEGHGYMSEAVLVLDSHLFEVGFNRVQIQCSDLNARSEKVPVRCDYVYEGTAREDALEKGRYRNTKMFSKLKKDL